MGSASAEEHQACAWACWVLKNTDMPKAKALRAASKKFGVTQAAVDRAVTLALGEDWLRDRGRYLTQKYAPIALRNHVARDF